MELTEKIARYVVELQYEQLPPEALAVAKTAFVDCIGVTLAGSREKSATICGQIARQERASAEASVYGQGFKSSALQAAFSMVPLPRAGFRSQFVFGPAHIRRDTGDHGHGRIARGAGRDLLAAYVAGFEVTAKIARSIPEKGRGKWHSAGTRAPLARRFPAPSCCGWTLINCAWHLELALPWQVESSATMERCPSHWILAWQQETA